MKRKESEHGGTSRKVRVRFVATIVLSLIFLRIYFVRELFVAELFFGLGLAMLFVLTGICYLLGMVAELVWTFMKREAYELSPSKYGSITPTSLTAGRTC